MIAQTAPKTKENRSRDENCEIFAMALRETACKWYNRYGYKRGERLCRAGEYEIVR